MANSALEMQCLFCLPVKWCTLAGETKSWNHLHYPPYVSMAGY